MKKITLVILLSLLSMNFAQAETVKLTPVSLDAPLSKATNERTHVFHENDKPIQLEVGKILGNDDCENRAYFMFNFGDDQIIFKTHADYANASIYIWIRGSDLKTACDKISHGLYLLDKNQKKTFYFPYDKFGIACANENPEIKSLTKNR